MMRERMQWSYQVCFLVAKLLGLCIDALIDATDANSDWALDYSEFSKALDPNHLLPRKRCALEERQFEDGAETKVDCNRYIRMLCWLIDGVILGEIVGVIRICCEYCGCI